ncbi:MAG: zinc ribbon domain-containing protein [Chloroflexi bacterium]|nr:zinc ribbon domain-containing protein [Chloroflexota bacterium]
MPSYDYRCKPCGRVFTLFYKSYKDYDAASPVCPQCGSSDLTRLIRQVSIARPSPNLANLSSGEMLSVLDGGDSREIGSLFQQVGDSAGVDLGQTYRETAERLQKGESVERIENDLRAQAGDADE